MRNVLPRLLHPLPVVLLSLAPSLATAQENRLFPEPLPGRYTPLNQGEVPGKVARWNLIAKPSLYGYFQPVQISLPSAGQVAFFVPEQPQPVVVPGPAQASLLIGPVYRVRVSGLTDFPGVELYPTIEITDRLHPPAGREEDFPIPIEITREEIEAALQDRMVTKVIYLERPQVANAMEQLDDRILTFDTPGHSNLLDAADQMGRPVAILRLGGRTPDVNNPYDLMLGPPAPLRLGAAAAAVEP
jgi:hypothetical protein